YDGRWECQENGYCNSGYRTSYSYFDYTTSIIKGGERLHLFQYAVGNIGGSNSVRYVASSTQTCKGLANCVTEDDISGIAAPQGIKAGNNIANWFAYYHTRELMAKSGLMIAFNNLSANYRF